jgi:hypothetical protein
LELIAIFYDSGLLEAKVRRREKKEEMCDMVWEIYNKIKGLENPTVDLTLCIMERFKTCAC